MTEKGGTIEELENLLLTAKGLEKDENQINQIKDLLLEMKNTKPSAKNLVKEFGKSVLFLICGNKNNQERGS